MNKNLILLAILFTVLCSLFTCQSHAMGTAPSTQEVEIIERIATQTEEAVAQEKYEMKVIAEIPWGSNPGELGVDVVEGLAIVPDRIAVDGKGNVYIFDKANNRINKYNKFGRFVKAYKIDSFEELPSKREDRIPILVMNDVDMGVDDAGNIYILNSEKKKIRKLNPKGEVVKRLPVPAKANYIRVERDGRVEAMRYKNGQIEIFDVSTKKVKAISGFKTPGRLSVVFEEQKSVSDPQYIKIFDGEGNLLNKIEIKIPYKLYEVNFMGTDEQENIYVVLQRQSDETKLKEIAPKKFKTIRLLGWYIRKYNKTGEDLVTQEKFILKGTIDVPLSIPGFSKCFTVDKKGNVYLMAMYGNPYGGGGEFKVIKWEKQKKKQIK